jgi:ubiquinone/menaquinone biosynthesis C-methylase UbiE
MTNPSMPSAYSKLQAWAHDRFVAERALRLHAYILEHSGLAMVLENARDQTLLDIGCGGGQSAIRLKKLYPHLRITGIDLSEEMISSAVKRAQTTGLALDFEIADAQQLPFPDGSYDVVYSFGSAKHWPDPQKGLGECWRVLKRGGHLLIADATSDATLQEVENFHAIAGFPTLPKRPIAAMLDRRMFRPARSVEAYRQIARNLHMPPGTVTQLPSMPAFLFLAKKPSA